MRPRARQGCILGYVTSEQVMDWTLLMSSFLSVQGVKVKFDGQLGQAMVPSCLIKH